MRDELDPLWVECVWMLFSILMIPFSSEYVLAGCHLQLFLGVLSVCVCYDIHVSLDELIMCMAWAVISS